MSDINDLIASNARVAFDTGVKTERERILTILKPLAEHDEEACYHEGKLECWPDDCSANLYQFAIDLIKAEQNIIKTDNNFTLGEQK